MCARSVVNLCGLTANNGLCLIEEMYKINHSLEEMYKVNCSWFYHVCMNTVCVCVYMVRACVCVRVRVWVCVRVFINLFCVSGYCVTWLDGRVKGHKGIPKTYQAVRHVCGPGKAIIASDSSKEDLGAVAWAFLARERFA